MCVVSTGHVCSLADLHRRALLLSPSRITTAAPLALSLSPPSAPGAATLFSLPVFFSTLVPPSVDDSPSHNTNRKFARPPISYTFTLAFTSHYLSYPSLLPQSYSFSSLFQIRFSCFRTLHSVRPLVILPPYSVSFLCYSSPSGVAYCRDS